MRFFRVSMITVVVFTVVVCITGCSNISKQEYKDLLVWCQENDMYEDTWVPVGRIRTSSSIYTGWDTYYFGFLDEKEQIYYSLEIGKGRKGHFYARLWGNCKLNQRDVEYQLSGTEHFEEVEGGEAFSEIYDLQYTKPFLNRDGKFEITENND